MKTKNYVKFGLLCLSTLLLSSCVTMKTRPKKPADKLGQTVSLEQTVNYYGQEPGGDALWVCGAMIKPDALECVPYSVFMERLTQEQTK